MTEWKVLATADPTAFQRDMNDAMRQGFRMVVLTINNQPQCQLAPYTAVIAREVPDLPGMATIANMERPN